MPDKKGRFTHKERVFSEAMANTGDKKYAATLAGYPQPLTAAHKALARPAIQAEITRIERERLVTKALPLAVGRLIKILENDKVAAMAHIAASKVVLEKVDQWDNGTSDKPIHELTIAELNARISQIEAANASNARAVDVEVLDTTEAGADDVFA
jgi:phage terminase small subunit